MGKKLKQFIHIIFISLLLCAIFPAVSAKEEKTNIIRVGYYEDGDYMSLSQQGEYIGYNIEYIQEIAKQSGLQFEIIYTPSWYVAYDMLVKGEIDLLPAVYYNENRAKEILFSTQPMCSIYTTLNVRMDDIRYDYEDFEAFQGMNVGIIKNGEDGESFKKFCEEHKISLNIFEYDETSAVLNALDDGTLDGVAITHLGKNSIYRSVAQFSPSPLYFAISKQNEQLLADINRAMNTILLTNPGYGTDLYDKYLAPSINQSPVFTKEERQFIEQADPIIVAYDPSFAPLSYNDKKTNAFSGIAADIFEFIAENSGLKFEYVEISQPHALELLQKGEIDALAVTDGDYLWDGRNKINSTLSYLSSPTSMITKYNTNEINVLALPLGYQLSETIKISNPNYIIEYYSTIEECLDAVLKGKVDATCLNTQVAGAYMAKHAYRDLRTTTLSQYVNEICIGISSYNTSELFSIINKSIQYLPAELVDAFIVENTSNTKEVTLEEFIEQNMWQVISVVCLVLGFIIFLISHNLKNALRSNQRIQTLLFKDELTDLLNTNGFTSKWNETKIDTNKQEYALLYGDINQFKLINDNFGFTTGNSVLTACGKCIQSIMDNDEFAARLSSDHFAILLKYNNWDQLLKRLNSFVKMINEWRQENSEIPYTIDFVFGVYLTNKGDKGDIHNKLDFANYARLHAKEKLDSFIIIYDEAMRNQALMAQQLEGGLEYALENNEFIVYYQPKVYMKDKKVVGSEALIRWNHPKKGFLLPGTFIPLFEKNGMIKKVDLWLFEDVCKTLHEWSLQDFKLLPVSCNFSRLHFLQPDFPEQIAEIANRWNVPHYLLELEVTESALFEEPNLMVDMFTRLKELGFRIAIDDFGSGYSSLGQLQQMTADILKLDRSFVSNGVTGKREQTVVRNVIKLSGELGMTSICEGVEDIAQSDILQNIGCEFAQGYYFYRPMKKEDYEKLLHKNEDSKLD